MRGDLPAEFQCAPSIAYHARLADLCLAICSACQTSSRGASQCISVVGRRLACPNTHYRQPDLRPRGTDSLGPRPAGGERTQPLCWRWITDRGCPPPNKGHHGRRCDGHPPSRSEFLRGTRRVDKAFLAPAHEHEQHDAHCLYITTIAV